MGHAIDGDLASWDHVAGIEDWRDLLVGNGLSSHLWPEFAYGSLYERASRAGILTSGDRALFQACSTENFESVLGSLVVTIRTLDVLDPTAGLAAAPLLSAHPAGARNRGEAVHISMADLPDDTRASVRECLREYRWVFTTSYDLVLYWCAGYETFDGFANLLCCNGRLEFDPEKTVVPREDTGLLYLHGALHLLTSQDGVARKRRSTGACLLEQFGTLDRHDPLARLLLVAEGSAGEKARIIQGSAYLSFALDHLSHGRGGLVIFGLGLRDEDAHLANALNAHPKRPIAVGMRPGEKHRNRSRQARLRQVLDADELYFFDATTHPLGDPGLSPSGGR